MSSFPARSKVENVDATSRNSGSDDAAPEKKIFHTPNGDLEKSVDGPETDAKLVRVDSHDGSDRIEYRVSCESA